MRGEKNCPCHVTVFPANNMAAEDLPSEFDVVILGTGTDTPVFFINYSHPDQESERVSVRSDGCLVLNIPESWFKPVRTEDTGWG